MQSATQGQTWLEIALNGAWTRACQPRIPVTVKEIVDEAIQCVNAGAAIVNVQARDESTGSPTDHTDSYARIIDGIRSKVDAIVYPCIAGVQRDGLGSAKQRFSLLEELARLGLIEWMALDPGSTNFALYDDVREDKPGFVFINPEEDIRLGLKLAMRHGLHPSYAIYEPGFLRLGASLHWRESCPAPIYRLMFSSGYTFSFPPEDYAVTAYLRLLDQVAPGAPWMLSGLEVDVLPMIPRAIAEGGHVRVGLQDAPAGCDKSNLQLAEEAVQQIENCGGALATAQDVRAVLSPDE